MPAHTHSVTEFKHHEHTMAITYSGHYFDFLGAKSYYSASSNVSTSTDPDHDHGGTNSTGATDSIDNQPAFYELAYIIKEST